MDEIGTIRWSGNLDYAGCTPRLKLPLGEYWLMQTPRMQVDGISAVVAPRIADVPAPPTYATRFVIEETPSTVLVEPAMENAITRVAAILTYALQFRQYFELPSVSFVAFAQESSVGAAFDGPYMHFGLTSNTGTSVTRSKFLIGHELGHYVQAYTISIPPSSYGPDPNAMCGCSHVMTSSSTHCLQSREYIGAARKEGFAHFFATHMFNWHWEEDCRFAYYKEWMDASGIVHAPPVDIDCDVPVRWMQSYCPGPDAGVEHDWLGFFWALLDDPDTHAGIAELHGIFDACTTFECPWTDLRAGATALYGSGSIGLARFEAIGAEFGVTSP
jgi:hypothetical protein